MLDRVLPLRLTKRIHWWTMLVLVAFTAVHVFLVLATGAIRNLNHLYALRDDGSWAGALVFAASLVATALVLLALRPRARPPGGGRDRHRARASRAAEALDPRHPRREMVALERIDGQLERPQPGALRRLVA